jgi:hypothetical protein
MATIWSIILNRKDQLLQAFWTEWRAAVVTQSSGPSSAGSIPMLDASGQLDPSLLPPIQSISLRTNGVPNTTQDVLDIQQGANITVTSDAVGGVLISASSSVSNIVKVTLTAGQNVNAYQVVAVHSDGLAYIASAATLADADRIVGVAITSALTGNPIDVQQVGTINNLGFSFTPGATVYLGLTGALVQTPNAGVFELPMGVATSASQLEVQMGLPIIFA